MGNLSLHFDREEFRCRCDDCGLDTVDTKLLDLLEDMRLVVGKPIYINCGIRCEKHNAEVGGAKKSQHLYGKAADIRVNGMSSDELFDIANDLKAGGIGIYNTFLHVDVREGHARWRV